MPLFNFHYPFPNYIGAFYHSLGWSLSDAFKLALATGYLSAGLFCYFWLSKIFDKFSGSSRNHRVSFVPYWFVELYVRGSVGEVIAIAWFMLVLAAIEYRNGALVSVATAGMILSHNILSMVFLPLLAGYMVLRTRWYLGYMIIGLGLAAYFWIPALWERNFVVGLNVVNFREHFPELFQLLIPFGGTNFSQAGVPDGEMSQQLGVMTIVVGMFALAFCIGEKEQWLKKIDRGKSFSASSCHCINAFDLSAGMGNSCRFTIAAISMAASGGRCAFGRFIGGVFWVSAAFPMDRDRHCHYVHRVFAAIYKTGYLRAAR